MNGDVLELLQWCAVVIFLIGAIIGYIRVRDWWHTRKYDDIVYRREGP